MTSKSTSTNVFLQSTSVEKLHSKKSQVKAIHHYGLQQSKNSFLKKESPQQTEIRFQNQSTVTKLKKLERERERDLK